MRAGRLIFAAILGVACATGGGAAHAEGGFFESLGKLFSSDDSAAFQGRTLYPEDVPRGRMVPLEFSWNAPRVGCRVGCQTLPTHALPKEMSWILTVGRIPPR